MNIKILTVKDIEKAYRKGFKDGVSHCLDDVMAAITITLQDKHGWDKEQLLTLEKQVNELFDNVVDKRVSFDEIVEAKQDEIGVMK